MKLADAHHKNFKRITFSLLFGVLVVSAGFVGSQYARVGRDTPGLSPATGLETVVLGESIDGQAFVSSVRLSANGAYHVTIKNGSQMTLDFAPGLQLYGVDTEGQEHPIVRLDDSWPLSGGPLQGGQEQAGVIYFDQAGLKAIRLYQSPGLGSYVDTLL